MYSSEQLFERRGRTSLRLQTQATRGDCICYLSPSELSAFQSSHWPRIWRSLDTSTIGGGCMSIGNVSTNCQAGPKLTASKGQEHFSRHQSLSFYVFIPSSALGEVFCRLSCWQMRLNTKNHSTASLRSAIGRPTFARIQ